MPRPMTYVNKRKYGEEVDVSETLTISSTAPYYIRLTEVPLRYINSIDMGSTKLKEQLGGTALSNRFLVDYDMGRIDFNESQSGQSVTVSYKGTGSVIWAEDLNSATARRCLPRSLTRAEILALPDEDKEIDEIFIVSDEGRIGRWDGTDCVV